MLEHAETRKRRNLQRSSAGRERATLSAHGGHGKLARVTRSASANADSGRRCAPLGECRDSRRAPHRAMRPPATADRPQQGRRASREPADEAGPSRFGGTGGTARRCRRTTSPPEPCRISRRRPPARRRCRARPAWIAFVDRAWCCLCCSLGANIYLGWTAWDARSRYRATLARAAPRRQLERRRQFLRHEPPAREPLRTRARGMRAGRSPSAPAWRPAPVRQRRRCRPPARPATQ